MKARAISELASTLHWHTAQLGVYWVLGWSAMFAFEATRLATHGWTSIAAARQAAMNKDRSLAYSFAATNFSPAFACSAREDLSSLLETLRDSVYGRESRTNIPRLNRLSVDSMLNLRLSHLTAARENLSGRCVSCTTQKRICI